MVVVNKTIDLNLVGIDGNAFVLLGAFSQQARREKWTQEEINSVTNEATKGDYDHLIATLAEHCNSTK